MSETILRDKIINWLKHESFQVDIKEVQNTDFQLLITDAYGLGFKIDIVKLKGKDIIGIAMGLLQPEEVKTRFMTLDEKEKARFIGGLHRELLKMNVDHNIKHDLSHIRIIEKVYTEDITRTSFMSSLQKVRDSALFTISTMTQKFSPEAPHSTSTPNNPAMYG